MLPHQSTIDGDGVHLSLGRAAVNNCSHSVHFYESDGLFLDSLAESVGGALSAEGACLILATESHLQRLHERLESVGIDVTLATKRNRYIVLEARETLSAFMRDGWPDRSTAQPGDKCHRRLSCRRQHPAAGSKSEELDQWPGRWNSDHAGR